jgi:hypothetical protein
MTVVRGFARHMSGIDPATQVPPLGLVTLRQHRRPPFIYSVTDIEALMAQVSRMVPTPLRAATLWGANTQPRSRPGHCPRARLTMTL